MKNTHIIFSLTISLFLFIGCGEDDPIVVTGCMDETACNYDATLEVTEDDGSCITPEGDGIVLVSVDAPEAVTFDPDQLEYDTLGNIIKGHELIADIYIKNESCEEFNLSGVQALTSGGGSQGVVWGQTKFCLGEGTSGVCLNWGVDEIVEEDGVTIASLASGNYLQGYVQAFIPGTYTMTYTISTCCGNDIETSVDFIFE